MWWSLTRADDASAATARAEQLIFADSATGNLLAVTPGRGAAPATVVGAGWTSPRAVAAHPDGSLLVADTAGAVWRTTTTPSSPAGATPIIGGLGALGQMVVPGAGRAAYVLAGQRRPTPPGPSSQAIPGLGPGFPGRRSGVTLPLPPWLIDRNRVVRVDLATGGATTVSRNHRLGVGLAVSADEVTAYVTEWAAGLLVAVDLRAGTRRVVVGGLARPGRCTWLDEGRGLLAVIEDGTRDVAVVDVTSAAIRRVPGCPGRPATPVRVGDLLVVAAGTIVAATLADAVLPERVVLATPTDPIYRGGYARVPVDLGSSGVPFDSLQFTVAEGPQFAALSPSRDDTFDPAAPHAMLLAGPIAGAYTLEARDTGGTLVASAPFAVTNEWGQADGPSMAFTGANLVYASGGTWGSLFNGVMPFGFTYGPHAVRGERRVALIFVNTADATVPPGTRAVYRNALAGGVLEPDGVRRSASAYYEEVSLGELAFVPGGESTVTLSKPWADYTEPFSATDGRFRIRRKDNPLIADAMWEAQNDIDFTTVDTAVFVVASPNGGQAAQPGDAQRYLWPSATSGTYLLNRPVPPPFLLYWWWKSLPWAVMPAEWSTLSTKSVHAVLAHELGHTLAMDDLYGDTRSVDGWDLMSNDAALPSLSLPHRYMLGWVDQNWLRTFNFRNDGPVDEEIVLRASELLLGGPPPGQRAGVVIERAEGWRYYFEYRSRQNAVTGTDPGPTQVADQGIPNDRRVLGFDVAAGWYCPPVARKCIRLLPDDGDSEGVALAVTQDYEEPDETGDAAFRLEVLAVADDEARVRVSYQPVPVPKPWPDGPDLSIRPWPGGDNWRSPDIRIEHALGGPFQGLPWSGQTNTIIATVTNAGTKDAPGVRVGFWVKDFTVSDAGPETFLGWATGDIAAGAQREFSMPWVPPDLPGFVLVNVHYCLVVRIDPYPRGEVTLNNNEAQANYTVMWTLGGSPFSRRRLPVRVANPYPDRTVDVSLHAEQRLPWYRTYVEHTTVRLGPGEVRDVEIMFECVADEPAFRDRVPRARLYGEPNIVTAVAIVADPDSNVTQPIGGATIEVRAARAAELLALDVGRTNATGRVRLVSDESPPPDGGEVVIATRATGAGRGITVRTRLRADGTFGAATPGFTSLPAPFEVDVVYLGAGEVGPAAARVTVR